MGSVTSRECLENGNAASIALSPSMFSNHLLSGYINTLEHASHFIACETLLWELVEASMEPQLKPEIHVKEDHNSLEAVEVREVTKEVKKIVKKELEHGIQAKFDKQLRDACWKGKTELVVDALAGGADINSVDRKNGICALNLASFKGYTSLAALLIAANATIDSVDGRGSTPLCLAATGGHYEMAELLVEHGADPARVDAKGKACVEMARAGGYLDIVGLLEDAIAAGRNREPRAAGFF